LLHKQKTSLLAKDPPKHQFPNTSVEGDLLIAKAKRSQVDPWLQQWGRKE
jgi:hypothetical protein